MNTTGGFVVEVNSTLPYGTPQGTMSNCIHPVAVPWGSPAEHNTSGAATSRTSEVRRFRAIFAFEPGGCTLLYGTP